jgi:predicted DsbA family dithiol-disulfide isomerase
VQTATRDRGTFETQQTAALAAGQQNRLWNFVEQFYAEQGAENSGYVNDSFLTRIARQIPGLNVSQWHVARSASALTDRVKADERTAVAAGVTGTPTLKQES